MRYIILGGGIAGTTAAEELRRLDADAEIILVCEEHEPLYSRVLLPAYAKGTIPREKVFLKKETWYADKQIEWLPGTRCEVIDARNGHVALSDGRELPFDRLLIATGGEPRSLPYEAENACYFHSIGDTDHLVSRLAALEGRAVAYGGSFISAELADAFLHRGVPTVVAFRGEYLFQRVLDGESGAVVTAHLRRAGADVRPGVDAPERLGLASGDLLGIGVGAEADLGWIRDAGVATGRGVLANARLETNVPGVYAAGDVAEFDDLVAGRRLMAGNWPSAVLQGRLAARNMAGAGEVFRHVTSYAANLAGLDIVAVGDAERACADVSRVLGGPDVGWAVQLLGRAGTLVGATLVGNVKPRTRLTNAIRDGVAFEDIWKEIAVS